MIKHIFSPFQIVYKRYASLFFCFAIDKVSLR